MRIVSSQLRQSLRSAGLGSAAPAPGHVTIGLAGRGIGASLSPVMHEQEGRRLGLNYHYHLIDFDRLELDGADLPTVLAEAQELGFAGLNVTFPFKQAIVPLLDGLAPDAASIGAVNTVVLGNGPAIGHNTDCWGFAESLRQGLGSVAGHRVLQLGSGGAGAAVAHALLQSGVGQLDIYDTAPGRADALAARLRRLFAAEVNVVEDIAVSAAAADGMVNATPVGMAKYPGLPIDRALVTPRHWIADVVYFPLETELVALGRDMGCRVLTGGGMAVYQAVRAFELFTGIAPDIAAMHASFQRALAS